MCSVFAFKAWIVAISGLLLDTGKIRAFVHTPIQMSAWDAMSMEYRWICKAYELLSSFCSKHTDGMLGRHERKTSFTILQRVRIIGAEWCYNITF